MPCEYLALWKTNMLLLIIFVVSLSVRLSGISSYIVRNFN
jgi:hypothetical protein